MNNYKVYKHTTPNGKVYIGVTSEEDINKRWKYGGGYKDQIFGKAVKKYGWNNIEHTILYEGLTQEEASKKEIELINKYKSSDSKYGYNITEGGVGGGFGGHNHTEEEKKTISEKLKGQGNVSVLLYERATMELIKKFDSVKDCAKYVGVNESTVDYCLRGRQKTIKNKKYIVRYKDSSTQMCDLSNSEDKLYDEEVLRLIDLNLPAYINYNNIKSMGYKIGSKRLNKLYKQKKG